MGAPTGVVITKGLKPWRGYPSVNAVHAIRAHIQQDQTKYVSSGLAPSPASGAGHVALTAGVPFHIGTIPQGAIILPLAHHILVAFNGTTPTIDIGVKDAAGTFTGGLLAALAVTTPAFTGGVTSGTLMGYTANQLELFIRLTGASTLGEADFCIPFYIQRD